jgi:peptidoglycan hydrolase CwlO-like protein
MASPRSKDQSSGSLSFTDVAQARGKSWADQKLADVHRIERMQAAEIVSLKNDVETVRSKARAAEAMAEELRQKLKAAQMERDLAAESRRPTRELAFAQPAVAAPLSSDADPEQISDMRERSASLEASLRASTEVAEQERVQRLDLSRQLGEARAELQRLRGKYEQRLASSAALQRQMETEAETARARLASAGARADAAAGEGARAARAMADGEAGDLRAQIVLLQQEKQNWARERETLTRERAALEAKLSGLSGKIKGVHQSIAASEAQVTAEERHLAALLREMKVGRSCIAHGAGGGGGGGGEWAGFGTGWRRRRIPDTAPARTSLLTDARLAIPYVRLCLPFFLPFLLHPLIPSCPCLLTRCPYLLTCSCPSLHPPIHPPWVEAREHDCARPPLYFPPPLLG